MGSLVLPVSGRVYVDTQSVIYVVEKHPLYAPLLQSLWNTVHGSAVAVITSDLTLMECLVMPLRNSDTVLHSDFENVLLHSDIFLHPISRDILLESARLRAVIPSLRTPDAIHAATATVSGCSQFITNDAGFRRIPGLTVTLLDDVIAAP